MDCNETLEHLNEFVDIELPDATRREVRAHLDRCPGCRAAYRGLVNLKNLVAVKTRRPVAPAGLRNVILRQLPPGRSRVARAWSWAAVLLGTVTTGAVVAFLAVPTSKPLAHAEVMRECLRQFDEAFAGTADPALDDETASEVLDRIHRETGVRLDSLPSFRNLSYVRCAPCSIRGISGVRVDFRALATAENGTEEERELISVFALPFDTVALPTEVLREIEREGHFCYCVEAPDRTLWCTLAGRHALSLVTRLSRETFEARFAPAAAGSNSR